MYINEYIFVKLVYYNGRKLGSIIKNIDEGKINIVETTKLIPPIKFNKDHLTYYNFAPRALSKYLIGKNFNELEIMFKNLNEEGKLDNESFINLMKQNEFFKGFFNHGAYVKNLENINGKNWISVTSTTTTNNKIPFDKSYNIIVTKIEGLGLFFKEIYIGSTVIFTVDDNNILIKNKANENSERWLYDEKERPIIIEQINKLTEEGKISIVNFENFKESVDLVSSLVNLSIEAKNLDELNLKREKLSKILNKGKPKKFNILSRDDKEKINFFKYYTKILNFSNKDINDNTNTEL